MAKTAFVTVAAYAEAKGVNKATIHRMVRDGELKVKRFRRAVRIVVDADEMSLADVREKVDVGIEAKIAVAAARDAVTVALRALELADARLKEQQ